MYKKIFITISIILVISLIAMLGYYFLTRTNDNGTGGIASGFKNLFPFGDSSTVVPNTPIDDNATTTPFVPTNDQTTNYTQKLRKISSEPVSGAGIVDVKISTSSVGSVIRYMEKATGHIYDTELFSPLHTRISNTTIPMSYFASWGNKNKNVVAEFLKDDNTTVQTYVFTVNPNINKSTTTTEGSMTGFALSSLVSDPQVLDTNLFYLEKYSTYSVGYIGTLDGSKRKQVWNSPLKDINSQLVNASTVAITTKPYQNINGFLYIINTNTGKNTKILGNIAGLSTLVDSTGSKVVFASQTNTLSLWSYDIKNQSTQSITPKTFPEKCVWSKKDTNTVYCAVPNEYLDGSSLISWYMGKVLFTDSIWKYDLKNNTSTMIGDLYSDGGESIDVTKPILSDSEQYLVFINKRDGSLWSLDLTK